MASAKQLSSRLREVFLSGTWIANTNWQHQIMQINCEEAVTKIGSLNTIASLTYHINYYMAGVLQVLQGGTLDIHDKYSFDFIPPQTEEEWKGMKNNLFSNAEDFAICVEQLSEENLEAVFTDEKYGTYRRNIEAMIEHAYYHLGQVSLIRKMIKESVLRY